MWHKILDTAASFHQRYIRPVWIRVHYSKLREVIDDDGEIEEDLCKKNGGDRSHFSANSQVDHYGSTCVNKFPINNNNTTTSFSSHTSLKNEEFDQVDAGFYRPTVTFSLESTQIEKNSLCSTTTTTTTDSAFKGSSSSLSCLKNSNSTTVTDLKHAIQFPSKRHPYRLVQEEADRIEIIPIESNNSSSKRRDSNEEYKKFNHLLQHHRHQSVSSGSQNNVEEILQSSNVVAKKSKSKRKKAFKHMKKIAGWTWKSLKQGLYTAPSFIIPQPETSIYAMATKYKVYFG